MFHNKAVRIFALFCITFAQLNTTNGKQQCVTNFKCSDEEKVVWATGNGQCNVFRNECHKIMADCERLKNNSGVLKTVSKEECQKLCSRIMTLDLNYVCATYNGVMSTFDNHSVLENHICRSGETYVYQKSGPCPGYIVG